MTSAPLLTRLALTGLTAWICAPPAVAEAGPMIREGREAEVMDLARPFVLDSEIGDGWVLDRVAIGDGRIRFGLQNQEGDDCCLVLAPSSGAGNDAPSFQVLREGAGDSCRRAVDRLAARIEVNDPGGFWDTEPDPIRAPGEVPKEPPGRDPWTPLSCALWCLLAVTLGVRAARSRGQWIEATIAGGLYATSLVLSLLLSPRGPGDGHLNLHAAFRVEPDLEWGPAPAALLRGLGQVVSLDGGVISGVNLLAAAAVPPLLFLLLRGQGFARLPAALAAALAGLSPLLLASAGSLNRQPLYLLCCLSGLGFASRYLRQGTALDLAGTAAAFALAALSRPEGAVVLILGVLWAAVERKAPRRSVTLGCLCVALAAASAAYLWTAFRGSDLVPGQDLTATGWLDVLWYSALLRPAITPTSWVVVWAAAIFWSARTLPRAAALALLAVLGLTLAWTATPVGGQLVGFDLQVASLRYQTLLLVPLALGLALAFEGIAGRWPVRGPWIATVLASALGTVALTGPSDALRPTIVDHEYRFLAGELPGLPENSRICVLLPTVPDVGFNDAILASDFVARSDLQWVYAADGACPPVVPEVPTFYYRGSWCTPALDHPAHRYDPDEYAALSGDCRALAATAERVPVAEATVPAVRWAWYDYETDTARIGFYRLSRD